MEQSEIHEEIRPSVTRFSLVPNENIITEFMKSESKKFNLKYIRTCKR